MKVAWIDTETTGLDAQKHGIIQVAIIIDIDYQTVARSDFRMNPIGKAMDPQAMAVHGLSEEQIAAYPPAMATKAKIETFLAQFINKYDKQDKLVPAGYNVDFDLGFLQKLWEDTGDKYFYSWFAHAPLDIYRAHRLLEWLGVADAPADRKLETMAKMYNIDTPNSHDAAADVETTRQIGEIIRSKIGKGGAQ